VAIYLTINKSVKQSFATIFDGDGFERAKRYKRGLIEDGSCNENQVTISGTDSSGNIVEG